MDWMLPRTSQRPASATNDDEWDRTCEARTPRHNNAMSKMPRGAVPVDVHELLWPTGLAEAAANHVALQLVSCDATNAAALDARRLRKVWQLQATAGHPCAGGDDDDCEVQTCQGCHDTVSRTFRDTQRPEHHQPGHKRAQHCFVCVHKGLTPVQLLERLRGLSDESTQHLPPGDRKPRGVRQDPRRATAETSMHTRVCAWHETRIAESTWWPWVAAHVSARRMRTNRTRSAGCAR